MNEDEEYILEAIKKWIWSGFYTESNVKEMIYDMLEEGCDENKLLSTIASEFQKKVESEKNWPEITDYEKLHSVFYKLHEDGICALHNSGYTMSDGFEDVSQVVHDAPKNHYHGFCFYHGQDVEGAVDGRGLMIAFGSLENEEQKSVEVGNLLLSSLNNAGFKVDWDGTTKSRVFLPEISWQKRAI